VHAGVDTARALRRFLCARRVARSTRLRRKHEEKVCADRQEPCPSRGCNSRGRPGVGWLPATISMPGWPAAQPLPCRDTIDMSGRALSPAGVGTAIEIASAVASGLVRRRAKAAPTDVLATARAGTSWMLRFSHENAVRPPVHWTSQPKGRGIPPRRIPSRAEARHLKADPAADRQKRSASVRSSRSFNGGQRNTGKTSAAKEDADGGDDFVERRKRRSGVHGDRQHFSRRLSIPGTRRLVTQISRTPVAGGAGAEVNSMEDRWQRGVLSSSRRSTRIVY